MSILISNTIQLKEVIWKKNTIFNLKLYDNGDQNIQFYAVFTF